MREQRQSNMIAASNDNSNEPARTGEQAAIQRAGVVSNRSLCREHYRLTLSLPSFAAALPGQFVHLSPEQATCNEYRVVDAAWPMPADDWRATCDIPMLRRAFSMADLRRTGSAVEVDVIYRVVGKATRWMQSLGEGDGVSVLGPLGNSFPIVTAKRSAWLVAGGVGLPPMLWLADALNQAGVETTAFCGAQSRDLLALTLDDKIPPASDAKRSTLTVKEFSKHNAEVVLSTDDGTVGLKGHIGSALEAYHDATSPSPAELVVYTCGPERMMRFVAEFCEKRGIACYVCMERAMACGTGTCQSCVVGVLDEQDAAGWRYRLCCTEGPVFDSRTILWTTPG